MGPRRAILKAFPGCAKKKSDRASTRELTKKKSTAPHMASIKCRCGAVSVAFACEKPIHQLELKVRARARAGGWASAWRRAAPSATRT